MYLTDPVLQQQRQQQVGNNKKNRNIKMFKEYNYKNIKAKKMRMRYEDMLLALNDE